MPTFFAYGRNESPRIAAWTAHYVAKGCHPIKAAKVAWQKVRNSTTWPNPAPLQTFAEAPMRTNK